MEKIIIKIPANFNFVPGLRVCIARIAFNFGFDEHEGYQIETIVDELCNNAIEHGSKGEEEVVTLECVFSEGQLELNVKDTGNKKFNVEEVFSISKRRVEQGWKPEELNQRGRGLIIVKKFIDGLDIRVTDKGTIITIIKKHEDTE